MIFTDRTIIVQKGTSSINDTIILYRGDRDIEVRFTLNEGSPFKFGSGASPNIIEKTEATYGQLVIKTPGTLPPIFSEVTPTIGGKIIFTITAEMIDEITEVGNYTFQIRLLDENRDSRATLPEVKNGIEIREPISAEDVTNTNEAGMATVGYALTTAGVSEDAFNGEGNYNKTTWGTGDRITAAKLNKIETGIEGVNGKVASSINDTTASTTTTYSSNKIEAIKGGLDSQITDIVIELNNENYIGNTSVSVRDIGYVELGTVTNGVNVDNATRARTQGYVPVSKNTIIYFDDMNKFFKFGLSFFDANKNWINKDLGWITTGYLDLSTVTDIDFSYIRLVFARFNNSNFNNDLFSYVMRNNTRIFDKTVYSLHENRPKMKNVIPRLYKHPIYDGTNTLITKFQDGTKIGNDYWIFVGGDVDHAATANIYLYDENFKYKKTITHNLGHANGVDYLNDRLVVYNGGGKPPEICLYKNPTSELNELLLAKSVQIIFTKDNGYVLPGDGTACFGRDETIVYYITKNEIYKIRLGTGSVNLSDSTGSDNTKFGTFNSSVGYMEYNGTAQILKVYSGDKIGQPQGATYDGYLYVGTDYEFLHAYKIELDDVTNTFRIVADYNFDLRHQSDYHLKTETEVVIKDGQKLILGANGDEQMLAHINLPE